MKRRYAIKMSIAIFMIIALLNISGYYYLSDAEASDSHSLEFIRTLYHGNGVKISVQKTRPTESAGSELDNDRISDREIRERHPLGLAQKNQPLTIVQNDIKPNFYIDENNYLGEDGYNGDSLHSEDPLLGSRHDNKHLKDDGDNSKFLDSDDTLLGSRADDSFMPLIREMHNLPIPAHGNGIVIEPIENLIPTESDIQGLPVVSNDTSSADISFHDNIKMGKDPEQLGQETTFESNDGEDNKTAHSNRDDYIPIDNNLNQPDDNDNESDDVHELDNDELDNDELDDNELEDEESEDEESEEELHDNTEDEEASDHNNSIIEPEDGEDSNRAQHPVTSSNREQDVGLDDMVLDNRYNLTKVQNIDLHNLTFLDNYYRYNYKAIEKRIQNRMEHIKSLCRDPYLDRSVRGFQRRYNLYQISELGMTWCPVFKSGSTTWRNYFIDKFVKERPDEYYLDLLKTRQLTNIRRQRKRGDGKQLYRGEDENNVRFSVIRHPYSRLISHVKSSARDQEMINQQGIWIQTAMIEGRLHRVQNRSQLSDLKTEFTNYFQWLREGKPGGEFNATSEYNPFLDPPHPTLSELVNHIIKKRRIRNDWDGHWMPGHEFCNICLHSFDYIIKLEEEPLELWYLVDKLGLWSDREVFLNRANSSSRKATEMLEVWDQLRTLDESQREFLDKHFDVDFKMFDYKRRKE